MEDTVAPVLAGRTDLQKYGDNARLLFALEVRFLLEDIHTVADTALTDGPDDKKCDLVFIDRDEGLVVLAQGYECQKIKKTAAPANKASDLNTALGWLLQAPIEDFTEPLASAAIDLRGALKANEVNQFEIWYVHNLPESANVQTELRQVEQTAVAQLKQLGVEKVQVHGFEVGREVLGRWYNSIKSPIQVTEEFSLNLPEGFEILSDSWSAYVCHVPASWLWEAFREHGEKLFSANVRGYLGSRKSDANINNGIKDTARTNPKQFWAYNNGVTAIVNDYSLKRRRSGKRKVLLSGLSIVNGAQTTGAIGVLTEDPGDEARVQARFVKCSDSSIIDEIIRYNNSQNKVEASDFRSNDPIQKRLRSEFESLPEVSYSGGKRGGADDIIRRNNQMIPSDAAAQALCAFHDQPERAYNRKSQLWKNDKFYNTIFNESTTAKHVLFVYTLLRAIQAYHHELKEQNRASALTKQKKERLTFFGMRGSTFLLLSAVARSLETVVQQQVSNPFKLRFKGTPKPAKARSHWTQLIEVLIPFVSFLKPAIEEGFKGKDVTEAALSQFVAMAESARQFNESVYDDFKNRIEYG